MECVFGLYMGALWIPAAASWSSTSIRYSRNSEKTMAFSGCLCGSTGSPEVLA